MKRYSLLLIPENPAESKRYQLSKFSIHLGLFLTALFVTFSTLMTWGVLHYKKLAAQNQRRVSPADELLKTQLLTKLNLLEDSLRRTQSSVTRLESMNNIESGKLKTGIGPNQDKSEDFGKILQKLDAMPKSHPELALLSENTSRGTNPKNPFASLESRVEEISEDALHLETRVNEIYETREDRLTFWTSTPSLLPVKGWITSDFGVRLSPFSGLPKMHEGIDIAAPYGSPIFATADGIATFTGTKGGYGNALIIDHGYGVSTLYGHTSTIAVQEGQKIKRGQLVAAVGSTGSSTGPHLHYEVHVDGVPTDPVKFIK